MLFSYLFISSSNSGYSTENGKKSSTKKPFTKSKKYDIVIPMAMKEPIKPKSPKPFIGSVNHQDINYEGCHSEVEKKTLEKNGLVFSGINQELGVIETIYKCNNFLMK